MLCAVNLIRGRQKFNTQYCLLLTTTQETPTLHEFNSSAIRALIPDDAQSPDITADIERIEALVTAAATAGATECEIDGFGGAANRAKESALIGWLRSAGFCSGCGCGR